MAIDGVIAFTRRTRVEGEDAIELFLVDRPKDEHSPYGGNRGQETLTILAPTWEPRIGMPIWGGDGLVIVVVGADRDRWYERVGYTRLREKGAFFRNRGSAARAD
jgi:hypothetical protein